MCAVGQRTTALYDTVHTIPANSSAGLTIRWQQSSIAALRVIRFIQEKLNKYNKVYVYTKLQYL